MPRKPYKQKDEERGPSKNEKCVISEDVQIGVHLAIERFRLDEEKTGK